MSTPLLRVVHFTVFKVSSKWKSTEAIFCPLTVWLYLMPPIFQQSSKVHRNNSADHVKKKSIFLKKIMFIACEGWTVQLQLFIKLDFTPSTRRSSSDLSRVWNLTLSSIEHWEPFVVLKLAYLLWNVTFSFVNSCQMTSELTTSTLWISTSSW